MTINWEDKRHIFTSFNAAISTSHIVSTPILPLFNEAIFKLSGLLNPSVATNVKVGRPVQTEVRKFTGSTGTGI
jgi:hypothetical protein